MNAVAALVRWIGGAVAAVALIVLCALVGALVGGIAGVPGPGSLAGVVLAVLTLVRFVRAPEPSAQQQRIADLTGHDPAGNEPFLPGLTALLLWGAGGGAVVALVFGFPASAGATVGCVGALIFGAVAAFEKQEPVDDTPDHGNVHGAAEAATDAGQLVEAGLSTDCSGGLFVGAVVETHEVRRRFRKPRFESRMHRLAFRGETSALVVGPPGSGKAACSLFPTLLSNVHDSKLVFDAKGELAAVCKRALEKAGHWVAVLNPAGILPDRLGAPAQVDVLSALDPDAHGAEAFAGSIAGILVPLRAEEKGGAFFSGSAQLVVARVLLYLRDTVGPSLTLPQVAEALHAPGPQLNDLFGRMRASRFASVRSTGNEFHMPMVDGKMLNVLTDGLRDVLSTVKRETAFLLDRGIAHMLGGSGPGAVDLRNLRRDLGAVFLCVPESSSESLQKAAHVVLAVAKHALLTAGGRRVLCLVDEMCTALPKAATEDMQILFSFARGFGVTVVGYAQSWPQLVAWAGSAEKADALRASAGAAIFFGANDPQTSAYIRREAGNFTVWTPNSSPFGLRSGSGPMGAELLRDDMLRTMQRTGWQVVFLMGSNRACILPRAPYYALPDLAARADPNPYRAH